MTEYGDLLAEMRGEIAKRDAEIETLRTFRDQVARATGSLEGIPEGHAFEVIWLFDDTNCEHGFFTAGMLRRAMAANE